MKIHASDYLLVRFAESAAPLLRWLGNRETAYLADRLEGIPIDRPIFISGLARAGTTILLEVVAGVDGVATHRYRDFPLLMVPWLWNRFLDWFQVPQEPVERPHRDRIRITVESPEAFEEPLWQHFFPQVHARRGDHLLGPQHRQPRFDAFFRDHLKKILLLRGGNRYASKGNYNFTRIPYLLDLMPDARFIIPVRHPLAHVRSLVRQHELFSAYAREEPRVPRYLRAAGHYEFGPQRAPVRISAARGDRVQAAWESGQDYLGYARLWGDVYRYIDELRGRNDNLARSMLVVRYEDFCDQPPVWLDRVLEHAEFERGAGAKLGRLEHVSRSAETAASFPAAELGAVWDEVEEVAQRYGYARDA